MNKRKTLSIITATLLCAAVVVGATLAYYNSVADPLRNAFQAVDSDNPGPYDDREAVDLQVAEPHWSDATEYQFENLTGTQPGDMETVPTVADGDWGYQKAVNFVPKRVIPKDPTVRSVGRYKAYVGVVVECADTSPKYPLTVTSLEELEENYLDIQWNLGASGWEEVNLDGSGNPKNPDKRYFVWNGILDTDKKTAALFETVTVKDNADLHLTNDSKWDILVKGYAVQAEGFEALGPVAALTGQFDRNLYPDANWGATPGAGAGDWTDIR